MVYTMFCKGYQAFMDGHLEETIQIARRMITLGNEVGLPEFVLTCVGNLVLRPRTYLGDASRVLERYAQPQVDMFNISTTAATIVYSLAHLSRADEVTEILERLVVARTTMGTPEDETGMSLDTICIEAATLIEHRQAVELLLKRLAGSSRYTTGLYNATCVGRHLGAAAAFLGRAEEARKYYADALEVAADMRFRPELALTRLQLAELLLEHYPNEKSDALEHLDFAINEFREMKMQPSLERALRHKEILGA